MDARTVKEQLLYEVHDPARYLTPDVVADLGRARVIELGADRASSCAASPATRARMTLKVRHLPSRRLARRGRDFLRRRAGRSRARLAADIVRRRLRGALRLRIDLIGAISILDNDDGALRGALPDRHARDVRLRVAGAHADRAVAERVLREVTALYCCGPAGGGGVRTALRPRLNMVSCTIDRNAVRGGWRLFDATEDT